MNNDMIPVGTTVHINPEDIKWECNGGDLISREALKKDFEERNKACDKWIANAKDEETKIRADATKHFICEVIMTIDNARTALFPLTVQIIDKVTDEDIEALKQLMKDYKPQILSLEDKRPQGALAEKLKERIEERVCKYCQMNKHCELCEISRVFQIITLTTEEQKGGAE